MSDYSQSKVYIIRCDETEEVYIGSTIQTLSERLKSHKNDYRKWLNNRFPYVSSFEIVKYDSCSIELLEYYQCNNGDELRKKEGEYIRKYSDKCVNMRIAGRSKKEYREENKGVLAKKKQRISRRKQRSYSKEN
jgi:hypothetical protein